MASPPPTPIRDLADLALGQYNRVYWISGEQFYREQREGRERYDPLALHDGAYFVTQAELTADRATRKFALLIVAIFCLAWAATKLVGY